MYKQAIRNNESPRNPKPRVFDVIVDFKGLEFKDFTVMVVVENPAVGVIGDVFNETVAVAYLPFYE